MNTPAINDSFPRGQSTTQGQAVIHSEPSPLSDISTGVEPFRLDHLCFVPGRYADEQVFFPDGDFVGEIIFNEVWQRFDARKWVGGDLTPWRPMRCVAEARAFIVSARRMQ
jgi:hypothetical protein